MLVGSEIFKKSREPKHRRVKDFVLEQMVAGQLKVGDPLPAEGVIAESLGVGRNTVRHAFAELVRQGFIERQQGRAAFVAREVKPRGETSMGVFGLILPQVRGSLYPSLIKGFGEIISGSGNLLAVCETDSDIARQSDAILQMIDRRALGVAMVPSTDGIPSYQLRQLEERGIPVVLCHRTVDDIAAAVVTWSWEEVGRLAGEEIAKQGHRRIAFVAYKQHQYTKLMEQGFRQALTTHGIDLPASRVFYSEQFINPPCDDDARCRLTKMLSSEDCPTAIFANDLDVGERVYHEALHLGLRVPENLSIVAFGGKWREGLIRQRLAAVTVDEVELGRAAAKILSRLQGNCSSSERFEQMVMPLEFFAGPTLAPL